MNFLAHFHLARPTDASRTGAFLGDFVRGNQASLRERFSPDLVEGIMLHRRIDQFTDLHPLFRQARLLLAPERQRFAGIIVDLFFDHFLTVHWSQFSDEDLDRFIARIHLTLRRRQEWLPAEVRPLAIRLVEDDWLRGNATIPGLALSLRRVSSRRPFLSPLQGAEKDLAKDFREFEQIFLEFYPKVVCFAATSGQPENPGGAFSSA